MTTRDAILDGALHVMQTRGLARTTTKEIARASGYSEATLYKLFTDKVELFLCVLNERLPRVGIVRDGPRGIVGTRTVRENLETMAVEIDSFYAMSMPIAMSLFSDTELLARHRDGVYARGSGPEAVTTAVAEYLNLERAVGRVAAQAPIEGTALSLVGACMHHAFLLRFGDTMATDTDGPTASNRETPAGGATEEFAASTVAALLPALVPQR